MITSANVCLTHNGVDYNLILWSTHKGGVQERRGDLWVITLMNATATDVMEFMEEKGVPRETLLPFVSSLPKA
jgi:hypothetical protein